MSGAEPEGSVAHCPLPGARFLVADNGQRATGNVFHERLD